MDFSKLPSRKKYPRSVLEDYKAALRKAEGNVRHLLTNPLPEKVLLGQKKWVRGVPKGLEDLDLTAQGVEVIAISRHTAQLMRKEWETYDRLIDAYQNIKWTLPGGWQQKGAERWHEDKYKEAIVAVNFEFSSKEITEEYTKLIQSYEEYYLQCIKRIQPVFKIASNKYTGMVYEWQEDPVVKDIYMSIIREFRDWIYAHPVDKPFMVTLQSKDAALGAFFEDRPDMSAALRLAQTLPMDANRHRGDPFVSDGVRFVCEMAVGLIPVVGNVVALWEAYDGHDLFGFELSDTERAIIAASVLLPMAGRLTKNGVQAYTAARAMRLFGKDLEAWEKATEWAAKAEQNHAGLKIIKIAKEELLKSQRLSIQVMKATATSIHGLSTIQARSLRPISASLERELAEKWAAEAERFPALKMLDMPAGESKTSISTHNMRGQLAEEFLEHWLAPILRTRAGRAALGFLMSFGTGVPRKLVYYPSHVIQSLNPVYGADLIDGLLGFWRKSLLDGKEEFVILAIFDSKAGRGSTEKMALKIFSPAQEQEIIKLAEGRWNALREEAVMAGEKFSTTLEEFQKMYLLTEARKGNQMRRHLERLMQGVGGQQVELVIAGKLARINVLKGTRVKMYGMIPSKLDAKVVQTVETEMRYHGFDFEFKSFPLTQEDVASVIAALKDVAERVLKERRTAGATPVP